MKLNAPRGMRDIDPDEYELLERIRACFIDSARIYGFKLMEPSPIELLSTLEAKSGPSIRNEIYYFRDKSGRQLGLRFDLTVGLTRYACSRRGLQLPLKLAAYSSMWRYDEPQYGRYRWFYQWDVEIFGPTSVESDAEVIEFSSTFLDNLGLKDLSIEVGDRGVVEEFLRKKMKIFDEEKIAELFRAVDKVGKKPPSQIVSEYVGKGICEEWLYELMDFGAIKGDAETVLSRLTEFRLEKTDLLSRIVDSLKSRQLPNIVLNMGVVRGLDYYTGIVFEVFDRRESSLGALVGGGRYDTLPSIFGRSDLGATGAAGGVERTALALSRISEGRRLTGPFLYVAYAKKELFNDAIQLALKLRRSGISTEIDYGEKTLRRQLESASSRSIPYAAILAPKEFSQGIVVLRDMARGEEAHVLTGELAGYLKSKMFSR